jgi:ATP-binding cassette subfamily B protein
MVGSPGPVRALWGVVKFLGRRPGWVALSLGLLAVNVAIELSLPQFLGNAISALSADRATSVGMWTGFSLRTSVALFIGLVLLRTLIGLVLGPIRNRTAQGTLGDIRAAVYDALQRQSFAWHDNARTGELISRASTDIARLQDFMFVCLVFSVDIVIGLLATTILIFTLSPVLGFLTLAAMVPTVLALCFFAVRLQPRWRRVHDRHAEMSTVIQENIAGVRVVKAFARERAEVVKFRGKRDAYLADLFDAVNYWAARVPVAQFIFGLAVPLVLWAGGRQVIAGTIPLGDLAKTVFYLLGLGARIGVIGQVTNIIQNASSAAQRVFEILEAPVALKPGRRPLPDGPGTVVFEQVSFRYRRSPSLRLEREPGQRPQSLPPAPSTEGDGLAALNGVSFRAEAGVTVALVGPTGAGKTTLLGLIPRFYDPSEGRVMVDGADVRELNLAQLRRSIGIVFQETFLFSASVAENVAFGRPSASKDEIMEAAKAAHAHEFILELAHGYDTIVGERGISLSGGQRQRIAIARAILGRPRIILLDDATSAVDSRTEREIREALRDLCRGRTTFVVAQRAATVRHADTILVLDHGEIVARGRHEALLRESALYQTLFQTQLAVEPEVPSHADESVRL